MNKFIVTLKEEVNANIKMYLRINYIYIDYEPKLNKKFIVVLTDKTVDEIKQLEYVENARKERTGSFSYNDIKKEK
ncbi:hypothetical protein D3C71_1734550 [compost metagenome]